jgi:hypothetical protein
MASNISIEMTAKGTRQGGGRGLYRLEEDGGIVFIKTLLDMNVNVVGLSKAIAKMWSFLTKLSALCDSDHKMVLAAKVRYTITYPTGSKSIGSTCFSYVEGKSISYKTSTAMTHSKGIEKAKFEATVAEEE